MEAGIGDGPQQMAESLTLAEEKKFHEHSKYSGQDRCCACSCNTDGVSRRVADCLHERAAEVNERVREFGAEVQRKARKPNRGISRIARDNLWPVMGGSMARRFLSKACTCRRWTMQKKQASQVKRSRNQAPCLLLPGPGLTQAPATGVVHTRNPWRRSYAGNCCCPGSACRAGMSVRGLLLAGSLAWQHAADWNRAVELLAVIFMGTVIAYQCLWLTHPLPAAAYQHRSRMPGTANRSTG
jgi:hypothetical protein